MPYLSLDPEKLTEAIDTLERRIGERFPESSLRKVCKDLLGISQTTKRHTEWVSSPIVGLRLAVYLLIGLIAAGILTTIGSLDMPGKGVDLIDFVQVLESGINDVVLISAAVFFLITLEARIKRGRALKYIHELRSIAHVIDMHQLTKDPERMFLKGKNTASSPKRKKLSPFELGRYLDYCSEMLALTSKLAALHVQDYDDSVALASVNEVENLTGGLSQKIWQKLMVLHTIQADLEASEMVEQGSA